MSLVSSLHQTKSHFLVHKEAGVEEFSLENSFSINSRQIENVREQIPFLDQKLTTLANRLLHKQHAHFPCSASMDLEILVSKDENGNVLIHFCKVSSAENKQVCQELSGTAGLPCREFVV